MTFDDLRASLAQSDPPSDVPAVIKALWLAGRGDWDGAHAVAQDVDTPAGAWVHAHLHRKEGDAGNAEYWYRKAGQPVCTGDLDEEWSAIVRALLP